MKVLFAIAKFIDKIITWVYLRFPFLSPIYREKVASIKKDRRFLEYHGLTRDECIGLLFDLEDLYQVTNYNLKIMVHCTTTIRKNYIEKCLGIDNGYSEDSKKLFITEDNFCKGLDNIEQCNMCGFKQRLYEPKLALLRSFYDNYDEVI